MKRIFYLGAPGPCGGANTEMGHTLSLWRRYLDLDITVIPTWAIGDGDRRQLESIGCKVIATTPATLHAVPGLAGSIVHSMCNGQIWTVYPILKELGCRIAWSNCMTFLYPAEEAMARRYGPCDAYHFQSQFQRVELEGKMAAFGYNANAVRLIPGAFDFDALPFNPRPHKPDEEFTIGRLARGDAGKWSSNHWSIMQHIPYKCKRAIAMGWSDQIEAKCINRPPWAETFPPNAMPVKNFLARCHAMVGLNGGARENWPRIGLECMATGVPIVAQATWGWPEMIGSEGGILADPNEPMIFALAKLAYEEDFRQDIIHRARRHVQELACPERIVGEWKKLFESLN